MMPRALGASILAAATVVAQQPTVTTVYSSGTTSTRYDMVVLGDGYQAQQQGQFNQDVQAFLTSLFQTQPYQTFATYYNVHTVFRASVDSGADHPDATPPIYRNTVYDASYNTGGVGRCLYINNTSQALADAALAPANEGRIIVLVNDSRYGGCAGTFSVSYNGGSMAQVQIHEIGHSLGQLADEYDYPNTTYTGGEPSQVNITTSPIGQKWSHWWNVAGVSAFQGAGYYLYGLYRPRNNCLMRTLGIPLCEICQENITKITNSICNAISATLPVSPVFTINRGTVQPFSFTHFVPAGNGPTIEWKLDGAVVPAATGPNHTIDTTGMTLGVHTVECSVRDHTPIVRLDPQSMLRHAFTWTMTVTDPTVADLRVPAMSVGPIFVTPGTPVPISTTVVNDGPATTPAFDVDWFLSTTPHWSVADIWLGSATVSPLAATQQVVLQHPVELPWRQLPQVLYVHAVVDRLNAVAELNENDNSTYRVMIEQVGPCVTKLEFADPLLYPFDAATVSASAGGAVHPTVVAPCAAPGSHYLIVWGCSGTAPGTLLAPGLTVPLNQDFCTQLGLAAMNGPWFQAFFGTLDAQGLGQATFALPANSGLWAMTGHFAGIVLDPTPAFAAVTNPVAITIAP
ncbi:MAG: M64 family metallopeptidase [Planctomycetota bacterium]